MSSHVVLVVRSLILMLITTLTLSIGVSTQSAHAAAGAAHPAASAAPARPSVATSALASRGAASTVACRRVASTGAIPANAAKRGWRIDCFHAPSFRVTVNGKRSGSLVGYVDIGAKRITIAAGMSLSRTRAVARQLVAGIPRAHRAPLRTPSQMCAQVAREYSAVVRGEGWTIRCQTRPIVAANTNGPKGRGGVTLGLAEFGPRRITILATDDLDSMRLTAAHELGHAIANRPDAAGLRADMTRIAGRSTFDSGSYVGQATEIWAESFARAWTGQHRVGSIQRRISVAEVGRLLRKHHLPYAVG